MSVFVPNGYCLLEWSEYAVLELGGREFSLEFVF